MNNHVLTKKDWENPSINIYHKNLVNIDFKKLEQLKWPKNNQGYFKQLDITLDEFDVKMNEKIAEAEQELEAFKKAIEEKIEGYRKKYADCKEIQVSLLWNYRENLRYKYQSLDPTDPHIQWYDSEINRISQILDDPNTPLNDAMREAIMRESLNTDNGELSDNERQEIMNATII